MHHNKLATHAAIKAQCSAATAESGCLCLFCACCFHFFFSFSTWDRHPELHLCHVMKSSDSDDTSTSLKSSEIFSLKVLTSALQ